MSDQHRRRMFGRPTVAWRMVLPALLVVVMAVVAVVSAVLPRIVAERVELALRDAGFGAAEVMVESLGPSAARLRLRLDPVHDDHGSRVAVDYRLGDLIEGRIRRVVIEGGRLGLRMGADGAVSIMARDPTARSSSDRVGGGLPTDLPMETLVIREASVHLDTPMGPISVVLDATATHPSPGVLDLRADLRPVHADARAAVTVRGVMAADGGASLEVLVDELSVATSRMRIEDGRLSLLAILGPTREGERRPMTVKIRARTADPVPYAPLAEPPSATSPGHADLALDLNGTVDPVAGLHGLDLAGTLALTAESAAVEGVVADLGIAVNAEITLSGDQVGIRTRMPMVLAGRISAHALPPVLAAWAKDRMTLRLGDGGTFGVSVRAGDVGAVVEGSGGFSLSGETDTLIRGAVDRLDARVSRTGAEIAALSGLRLTADALPVGGGMLRVRTLDTTVTDADGADADGVGEGRMVFDFGLDGSFGGVTVAAATVRGRVNARLAGDGITIDPDGCIALSAERIAMGTVETRDVRIDCMTASEAAPFVTVAAAASLPFPSVVGMTMPATPVSLVVRGEDGERRLNGRLPAVVLTRGEPLDGASPPFDIRLSDGRVTDAGLGVEMFEIGGRLRSGAVMDDASDAWTGELLAAVAAVGDDPPLFARSTLSARFQGSTADGIGFTGAATVGDDGPTLAVDGRYDGGAGTTDVRFRLRRTTFGAGGADFATLFPALADDLSVTAGTLAVDGRLTLVDGVPRGSAKVLFQDVGLAVSGLEAVGINAALTADTLFPLSMSQGQAVAIGGIDVGVPLTDGLIVFGLEDGTRFHVERARWEWAGGEVFADSFSVDPTEAETRVTLQAEGVELGKVMELIAVEGLAATGRLSGRLPLTVRGTAVAVDGGVLESVGGGHLRYDPRDPPAFLRQDDASGTAILMQALTDFRYERLTMTLDGLAGGELRATLRVEGANPEFYDGYPVALNVNLSGQLGSILRRGLGTYRIPETVLERMREFGSTGR